MKRMILMALWLSAFALFAASPKAQAWNLGMQAYQAGDFVAAESTWTVLEHQGVRNVRMYHNLGDACYRQGKVGAAILNYKKALRMDPNDLASRQSLAYAMAHTLDTQSAESPDALLRMLHRLDRHISLNLLAVVWLLLTLLSVAWLNRILIFDRGRDRTVPLFVLTVFVVFWALAGTYCVARWIHYRNPNEGVVTSAAVDATAIPNGNGSVFTVHEGFVAAIKAHEKGYTRIQLPNGTVGWVPDSTLSIVK